MADRVLRFEVDGPPRAKRRARIGKHGGYTPESTREYERRIRAAAIDAKRKAGWDDEDVIEGPVHVIVMFRVAGKGKKTVVIVRQVDESFMPKVKVRPDLDNALKAVLDGLQPPQGNGVDALAPILVKDDRQVVGVFTMFEAQAKRFEDFMEGEMRDEREGR